MRTMIVVLGIVAGVVAIGAQTGRAAITLTTTPDPPGLGQNRFDVLVKDAAGQPVTDAQIALLLVMPADPKTKHPEMRTEGTLSNAGAGKYTGVAMIAMAGTWNVTVTAARSGTAIGQTKATLTAHATRPGAAAQAKPVQPPHGAHTHTHEAAAALKNPTPATNESVANGAMLFAKHCVSCHGARGQGDGAMAAKLKSKPANLTDAEWKHGPSDGEIFTLIRDGAKNAGMKPYRGVLTDRQMWDLVNHIRSMSAASVPAP